MGQEILKDQIDYSVYLVTDRDLMTSETLEEAVEQAIKGGATLIQLREKKASSLEFYNMAVKVKQITDFYNVPLIINDRLDIALAVDPAGIHLGQDDLPAAVVRKIIGENKVIGVSVSTPAEAVRAREDGADYLGVGAMFSTETKKDIRSVSMQELKKIRKTISLPIVVIGGINKSTIPQFTNTGIDGIAVVSAIIAEENIKSAAEELKELFLEISLP